MRIHHVAIIASDYARAKDFYTRILGFEIIRETYREERKSYKLDLRVGEAEIELFSFPNPPPRVSNPETRGLRHLAFTVPDFDATRERLLGFGLALEEVRLDPTTGRRYFFFRDPDDLPLEIVES
ncbi:MAG TPA: VOC family protein [Candidatus Methylacidiphilales bacterium]|jgi:glyoxylase I family protein|nr:VOC family protein [Candidatus Methylacidiphilales bacterium]